MVRTRKIDLAKETFWREQMERQVASGLSIADWCRQNRLSSSIFHYWRRTLARRDRPITAPQPGRAILAPAAFVPVLVEPQSHSAPIQPEGDRHDAGLIEILFHHRSARVRVAPGFDAPTLARLLDVLAASSC